MRTVLAVLSIHVFAFAANGAGKQPITGADVLKIRNVTSVAVASDGAFAVYGVQTIHTEPPQTAPPQSTPPADAKGEPAYKYRTHLWRIDLNDPKAKPEQLTFGDRNDSSPVISPDNRTLAFVRVDNTPGATPASALGSNQGPTRPRPQIWLLPLGGPGEAQVITKLENGAFAPVWRHDGKALLVTSDIPISKIEGKPHFDLESPERDWFDWDRPKLKGDDASKGDDAKPEARPDGDRRALRNWLARNASKDNPTVINRMDFLGEQDLQHEMEIAELFTIDLGHDNQTTQITKDFYNHMGAEYSPDGRTIVYVSTPPGNPHPDRLKRSAVWMMGADGSKPHTVLDQKEYAFNSPRFTHDGASLVVAGTQIDEPAYRQSHLARFDFKDSKPGGPWVGRHTGGVMKVDASAPPSGTLTAIDVNSGKIGWQYKSPRPMYGGVLATASDLVFAGEQTGDFSAFDARSGEKLWSHHFDTGVCSPPMTYRVAEVQYIAVGANGCRGGHVANGASPYGDMVAIFALQR